MIVALPAGTYDINCSTLSNVSLNPMAYRLVKTGPHEVEIRSFDLHDKVVISPKWLVDKGLVLTFYMVWMEGDGQCVVDTDREGKNRMMLVGLLQTDENGEIREFEQCGDTIKFTPPVVIYEQDVSNENSYNVFTKVGKFIGRVVTKSSKNIEEFLKGAAW